MTARHLHLPSAFSRLLRGSHLVLAGALLAATAAQSAPLPPAQPQQQLQQVAFTFGRALVVAAAPTRVDTAPQATASDDATHRSRPYRSACNFTTGC